MTGNPEKAAWKKYWRQDKMKYFDEETFEDIDEDNEKKTAKEILNKKKVTKFEMDMVFIEDEDDEKEEEDE